MKLIIALLPMLASCTTIQIQPLKTELTDHLHSPKIAAKKIKNCIKTKGYKLFSGKNNSIESKPKYIMTLEDTTVYQRLSVYHEGENLKYISTYICTDENLSDSAYSLNNEKNFQCKHSRSDRSVLQTINKNEEKFKEWMIACANS